MTTASQTVLLLVQPQQNQYLIYTFIAQWQSTDHIRDVGSIPTKVNVNVNVKVNVNAYAYAS